MAGQSVHERLRRLEYPLRARKWTESELAELRKLAGTTSISEIAHKLGRPYSGVALKISRLGLAHTPTSYRRQKKIPRGSGYTKEATKRWLKELEEHEGSLRQFVQARGLSIDLFVTALQRYQPEFWDQFSQEHGLEPQSCAYCGLTYYPMTARQKTCSRKCQADKRRDEQYFGGKRRQALGLLDKTCQLCLRQVEKGLSAHHLLGKENDPDNNYLVALCPGCHQLVGILGGRKFAEDPSAWERLIVFVLNRRLADREGPYVGAEAYVELDWLSPDDVTDEDKDQEPFSNEDRIRITK